MSIEPVAPREGKSPYWYGRGEHLGTHVNRSTKARKLSLAKKVIKKWELEIECGEFSVKGEMTFKGAAWAYMQAGGERKFIAKLVEHFGETPIRKIDQGAIDAAASTLYPAGSAATRNRQVYTPISAILRQAGATSAIHRPRGSGGNKATAWLWPEQAEAIFEEAEKLDPEFAALLIVLCYTGLRLSEALRLTWNDVRLADGFAYIPDTKNDDPRAVFLPPVAVAALANFTNNLEAVSRSPRVFRFAKGGHLYSLLRVAAIRADCDLPARSAFHIFRHTYATWMRRYGGLDTRGLVATGAWRDRKSADRYEHAVVTEEARKALLLPTPKTRVR